MLEQLSKQLKANFTPDQQEYYSLLENELDEIKGGRTEEEIITAQDFKTLQRVLDKKQEILNFVLTKKTREMTRQEEEEREKQSISLDEIERKQKAGEELTNYELRFLYLIDGFGRGVLGDTRQEGRVRRIIRQLNTKEKLAELFYCEEDEISFDADEFLSRDDIVYHFGNLDLEDVSSLSEGFTFPEVVNGFMNLSGLQILPVDVLLPEVINGYLSLPNIIDWPKEVYFPKVINGDFDLSGLKNLSEGTFLPEFIGGDFLLDSITSIPEKTRLPQVIKGTLYLSSLVTIDGLNLSPGIKSIHFRDLPVLEQEKFRKKYPQIEIKNS